VARLRADARMNPNPPHLHDVVEWLGINTAYLNPETWLPEPLREGTNPATSAFAGVPLRRERLGERRAPQGCVDDSLLTGLHDARAWRPNIRI
jgi:hypothetical protein